MKNLKKLFYKFLMMLSRIMRNKFFYLQFQMETGSKTLFSKKNHKTRKIVSFNPWDTVRKDMLILVLKDIVENTFHSDSYSQFNDTNVASVLNFINPENDNVIPIVGMFPQSLPDGFDKAFSFVHMDMDLYQPTIEALRYFYLKVSNGGYMIAHDYNNIKWPGIKKAVDEFFKDKKEHPVYMS